MPGMQSTNLDGCAVVPALRETGSGDPQYSDAWIGIIRFGIAARSRADALGRKAVTRPCVRQTLKRHHQMPRFFCDWVFRSGSRLTEPRVVVVRHAVIGRT